MVMVHQEKDVEENVNKEVNQGDIKMIKSKSLENLMIGVGYIVTIIFVGNFLYNTLILSRKK